MSNLSLALLGKSRNALSSSRVSLLGATWRAPFRTLSTDGNGDGEPSPGNGDGEPSPGNGDGEPSPGNGEPSPDSSSSSSTIDPFLQPSEGSLVFGKLTGIARNAMKSDAIHFLEGCGLSPADIKVEYNRIYSPVSMMIQFPSQSSYDTAVRQTVRKGRLYNLNKVDRSQWEYTKSYDGKTILLQGIPRSAMMEDIERFLSGCNYDASDLQVYPRSPVGEPRYALVKCSSHVDAVNACLVKNRSFCQNSSLRVRVLQ